MDKILATVRFEKDTVEITGQDIVECWDKELYLTSVNDGYISKFNIEPVIQNDQFKLKVSDLKSEYRFFTEEIPIEELAQKLACSLTDGSNNYQIKYIDNTVREIKRKIQLDFLEEDNGLFYNIPLSGVGVIAINGKIADVFGSMYHTQLIDNDHSNKNVLVFEVAVRRISNESLKGKMLEAYFKPNDSNSVYKINIVPEDNFPSMPSEYILKYQGISKCSGLSVIPKGLMGFNQENINSFVTTATKILNKISNNETKNRIDIF